MRVDWEVVSGVSSVVSAAIAALSLGILYWQPRRTKNPLFWRDPKPLHYLLFCSGWVLCVVAGNWILQPFGLYLSETDQNMLYGVMLSAPALLLVGYAFEKLKDSPDKRRKDEQV